MAWTSQQTRLANLFIQQPKTLISKSQFEIKTF